MRSRLDQAAAALVAVVVPLAAEHRSLEVVVVLALLLARVVVRLELSLDGVKGGLIDEVLVLAFVIDASVTDDPT